jgi:uncharacterized membrane protein YbhN (UPF0104 family)
MTVLLDKVYEYSSQVLLGLMGLLVLSPLIVGEERILAFVLFACVLIGTVYLFRRQVGMILRRLWHLYSGSSWARPMPLQAGKYLHRFFQELQRISWRRAASLLILSISVSLVDIFSVYLLALSLNMTVSLPIFFAVLGVLRLVLSAPFILWSVGGIGIREGTLVLLFQLVGESAENAIALSALMFLQLGIWTLAGVFAWLRQPLDPGRLAERAKALRGGTT